MTQSSEYKAFFYKSSVIAFFTLLKIDTLSEPYFRKGALKGWLWKVWLPFHGLLWDALLQKSSDSKCSQCFALSVTLGGRTQGCWWPLTRRMTDDLRTVYMTNHCQDLCVWERPDGFGTADFNIRWCMTWFEGCQCKYMGLETNKDKENCRLLHLRVLCNKILACNTAEFKVVDAWCASIGWCLHMDVGDDRWRRMTKKTADCWIFESCVRKS